MIRISITKKDLRRETFRSGRPGGQHQNTSETGVRLTHIPTGISAEGRTERSQYSNEQACYALLIAKLYRHYEEEQRRQLDKAYDNKPDASFGNQIRTYRLCGKDQNAVDHRTGLKQNIRDVLDGKIDPFLKCTC